MGKLIRNIFLISSAYLLVCVLGYLGFATLRNNLVGWFLLLAALAYGVGGPFLLRSNLKNAGVVQQEKQDRSFWLILPGFLVVYYASPLEYLYMPAYLPRSSWTQIIGLILIVASTLMIAWAQRALKGKYTGRLRVVADQPLVQAGPYHFLRHPAYAGFILMCLGISIGFSSLIGLLAVPFLLLPGLLYRINAEEKILIAQFGEEYIVYSRHTKRLLPGIW